METKKVQLVTPDDFNLFYDPYENSADKFETPTPIHIAYEFFVAPTIETQKG